MSENILWSKRLEKKISNLEKEKKLLLARQEHVANNLAGCKRDTRLYTTTKDKLKEIKARLRALEHDLATHKFNLRTKYQPKINLEDDGMAEQMDTPKRGETPTSTGDVRDITTPDSGTSITIPTPVENRDNTINETRIMNTPVTSTVTTNLGPFAAAMLKRQIQDQNNYQIGGAIPKKRFTLPDSENNHDLLPKGGTQPYSPYDYPKFTGTATYTLSREPLFTRNQVYDFNINQQKHQSYELKPKMGTQVTQMYKEPIITPNLYDPNYWNIRTSAQQTLPRKVSFEDEKIQNIQHIFVPQDSFELNKARFYANQKDFINLNAPQNNMFEAGIPQQNTYAGGSDMHKNSNDRGCVTKNTKPHMYYTQSNNPNEFEPQQNPISRVITSQYVINSEPQIIYSQSNNPSMGFKAYRNPREKLISHEQIPNMNDQYNVPNFTNFSGNRDQNVAAQYEAPFVDNQTGRRTQSTAFQYDQRNLMDNINPLTTQFSPQRRYEFVGQNIAQQPLNYEIENQEMRQHANPINNTCHNTYLKRLTTIPDLSGESFENLKTFIEKVDTLYFSAMNDAETDELYEQVLLKVNGEARDTIMNLSNLNWENIKKSIMKSFDHLCNKTLLTAQLENLKQEKDESLTKYTERARKLLQTKNAMYKQLTEDQRKEHNRLAYKAFVNGLKDPSLKRDVNIRGADTLEQAIHNAIDMENDSKNAISRSELFCRACKATGHREIDCRRKTDDNAILKLVSAFRNIGTVNMRGGNPTQVRVPQRNYEYRYSTWNAGNNNYQNRNYPNYQMPRYNNQQGTQNYLNQNRQRYNNNYPNHNQRSNNNNNNYYNQNTPRYNYQREQAPRPNSNSNQSDTQHRFNQNRNNQNTRPNNSNVRGNQINTISLEQRLRRRSNNGDPKN